LQLDSQGDVEVAAPSARGVIEPRNKRRVSLDGLSIARSLMR
jgi:hypothetical protein